MLCFLCFSQLGVINFIKKTKMVRVPWLAERSVCTRVCKHGCDVTKMFCFLRANHTSTNLKNFFSLKLNKFTLFTHSLVGWILENLYKQAVSIFFFVWANILSEKNLYFGKHLFCKTRTEFNTCSRLCVPDFATGKNFSFKISAITKSFVLFLRKVILFLHSRGWENSRQLCKP